MGRAELFDVRGYCSGADPGGGMPPPLKPIKVTFFAVILYKLEKGIRDIRPCWRLLIIYHSSVMKYTSCLLH